MKKFLLFNLLLLNCSQNFISSEDQKCRELYLFKHGNKTPQETCLELIVAGSLNSRSNQALDLALITCYFYLDKWKSCGDESSIKPVIIRSF